MSLEGVRDNQLIGYGLVVGLAGTGDRQQTMFSAQSLTNMLERMGVTDQPHRHHREEHRGRDGDRHAAAVRAAGTHIDVTAAAIGDAQNLQGGLLLLTSLRGAMARSMPSRKAPWSPAVSSPGRGGNSQTVNHPTVGRVPAGAIVERPRLPSLPPARSACNCAMPISPPRPASPKP